MSAVDPETLPPTARRRRAAPPPARRRRRSRPAARDRAQPRRAGRRSPRATAPTELLRGLLQLGRGSPSTSGVIRERRARAGRRRAHGQRARVRLFHDHLLVKEAGSAEPSPWHQDQPYYCVDGSAERAPSGSRSTRSRGRTRSSSSRVRRPRHLVHAAHVHLDRPRSSSTRASWRTSPTSTPTASAPTILGGSWTPATPSPSTCSPCTRPAARRRCAGRSRCACWATTPPTPRARTRPARPSRASTPSSTPATRSTRRGSRCSTPPTATA